MNSVQRILSYSDVPQDGLSGFAGLLRMALPQTPGRIQKVDPLIGVPIKYPTFWILPGVWDWMTYSRVRIRKLM